MINLKEVLLIINHSEKELGLLKENRLREIINCLRSKYKSIYKIIFKIKCIKDFNNS